MLGILFFPLTVFITLYSLMISGTYIKQWNFKSKERIFKILGFLITLFTPLLSIIWFTFINLDYYSIAAIAISLLVFLQYGLRISKYSLNELIDKYTNRRIQKFPKIFHYILIFILIAFPISFLRAGISATFP